jgi:chromosome segregation ATPase
VNIDPASGVLWGFAGVAISKLADYAMQRRASRAQTETAAMATSVEVRREDASETDRAYTRLLHLVERLERQVTTLGADLDEERELRRRAESRVRELEESLHSLKLDLSSRGFVSQAPAAGLQSAVRVEGPAT